MTLAQRIGQALSLAISQRRTASLVLSGGNTPGPLFDALSELDLPWNQVQVTLADERWVTADHEASNEGMVRRRLLRNRAAEATMIGLVSDHPTAAAGATEVAQRLASIHRPFDVVILGMGTDGHTASLFPGAPELAAGLDPAAPLPCLAVHPPDAPHARISLTAKALIDSRWRILHLRGSEKWQVFRRAATDGPVEDLPVRKLLQAGLDVYWSP